jgi:hypothetical protein
MLKLEERTTSQWYDDLREGTFTRLIDEVNSAIAHPNKYETYQLVSLRCLLYVNDPDAQRDTLRKSLQDIIDARNEQDRFERAEQVALNKAALANKLTEARSCLINGYRRLFSKSKVDHVNRRIVSDDGVYALKWLNKDTTVGAVRLDKIA